jgi:hypothetical protein
MLYVGIAQPLKDLRLKIHDNQTININKSRALMASEEDESEALSLEKDSVHRVYDIIASHFSETRYKVQFILDKAGLNSPGL